MTMTAHRRRDRRIPRAALQQPSMPAFMHLFGSGCEQSLIKTFSIDHTAFRVLELFDPLFSQQSPYSSTGVVRRFPAASSGGSPRSMNDLQCLSLSLASTSSRGAENMLCIIFGTTGLV